MLGQFEQQLGGPFGWFAVRHENPEHRHVHVVAVTKGRLWLDHGSER
jgi:hypothetical protein